MSLLSKLFLDAVINNSLQISTLKNTLGSKISGYELINGCIV